MQQESKGEKMFLKMTNGKCWLKTLILAIVIMSMSGCMVTQGRGKYIKQERLSLLKEKNLVLWRWGERGHSILILPVILIISGFIVNINLLYLGIGSLIHLILDMISHKRFGPLYFWPFKKEFVSIGLFQWEDYFVLGLLSHILFISLIIIRLQFKI